MRKSEYNKHLLSVLNYIRNVLGLGKDETFDTAVVLGTGWGDHLDIKTLVSVPLVEIGGFTELDELDGHERRIEIAEVDAIAEDGQEVVKKRILVLRGRIHMNEDTFNPGVRLMVRMQVELLFLLGVKKLILTCSAGAVSPRLNDGDIVVIDRLPSFGSGEVMPLFPGEFKEPDVSLYREWIHDCRTSTFSTNTGVNFVVGPYMFYRGPHFETPDDKEEMRRRGAIGVGMSMKPECAVAALHEDVQVIALGFVSNRSDEEPSHELHKRRAKEHAPTLSRALELAINY